MSTTGGEVVVVSSVDAKRSQTVRIYQRDKLTKHAVSVELTFRADIVIQFLIAPFINKAIIC